MAISVNSHKLSPVNDIPIVRLCGGDYNKGGEGKGKPKNMCEVLDRAEERGRKIGEEIGERRGEKRGEKRGERRGIRKGKIQLLRKWVRSDRISIESAAEEIGMTVDAFRKEAKL